jgi:3-oxoacyl-[acyl-carrier protein] reductase
MIAADLRVGAELVSAFAQATGDRSSLHIDPQFARKTLFREPIAHGLLPVILLLGWIREHQHEHAGPSIRLTEISCRFRAPVKIGESVHLEAEMHRISEERTSWSLSITHGSNRSLITSGKAIFTQSSNAWDAAGHRETLLAEDLCESAYLVSDLEIGMNDRLAFWADPAAFRPLDGQLDLQFGKGGRRDRFSDSGILALACLSTLVGMRLPGRYATFTDFDIRLPVEIDTARPVILGGTVANILPSGSRMRLDLAWAQGAETVGSGTATAVIGSSPPASTSAAEIRAVHLGYGIEEKVALITGASRGIGEAIAKTLAVCGALVVVHFFRGEQDARDIVKDITENGGRALAVQADITNETAVAAMFEKIESSLGPVDILVNNAVGDFTPKPLDELRSVDFLAELNVSLLGMHTCCRMVLPHMRRQRWGKIINMGTIATETPVASQSKYIAAKSAVVGYTRSLATEAAADNIQVNLVAPAMTATSLISALPAALIKRLAEDSPGGSLLAPIEVAKVVLFLASDWSASMSGQQLILSKGTPPFL